MELFCFAYLGDVVVYSGTWKQHLKLLKLVVTHLADASLVLSPDKSEFGKGSVSYLGKFVGHGVVKPLDDKV